MMYIKDIVYGDIEIPEKFQEIIDTPEFQRLRRIKQLATANLVFPAANHSRFEHCIGTFHVMKIIINHFIDFFGKLDDKIVFDKNDIDALLMAALLHDIGHGPFSHAFEQAMGNRFNHEEMTCKIITSTETEINKKLKRIFGDIFPQKVVGYIDLRNEYKENSWTGEKNSPNINALLHYRDLYNNFTWIFHQLVSSQIDADRMDYILRDAKAVNVPFGNFNITDLVSGMRIAYFKSNYHICISEKNLNHVEGYLYARHQMYQNVYMNSYKLFTEELLKRILERVSGLYMNSMKMLKRVPVSVAHVFEKKNLEITEFLRLDDHVLMGAIQEWKESEDKVLSVLCDSLLNRSGFERVIILANKEYEINLFKNEFFVLCSNYLKIPDMNQAAGLKVFNKFYFWVENTRQYCIYDKKTSPIYIQCDNGMIKELSELSSFLPDTKKIIRVCYLNFELLALFFEEHKKEIFNNKIDVFIDEVRKMMDAFNLRRQFEIETKYLVKLQDNNIFDDIIKFIRASGKYTITEPQKAFQQDEYYDYPDHKLTKSGQSFRVRINNNKYTVTFKSAIKNSNNVNQVHRIEKEVEIDSSDVVSCWAYIVRSIPDLNTVIPDELVCILSVKNNREKVMVTKNQFIMEIVFDDVLYCNGGKEYREKQIEIELKSAYEYQINLRAFTESLELSFGCRIEQNIQSKLMRGLHFTKS